MQFLIIETSQEITKICPENKIEKKKLEGTRNGLCADILQWDTSPSKKKVSFG